MKRLVHATHMAVKSVFAVGLLLMSGLALAHTGEHSMSMMEFMHHFISEHGFLLLAIALPLAIIGWKKLNA